MPATTVAVTIIDPESAADGILGAFDPAALDMTANARAGAEDTVTDEDVAGAKAMANAHDYGCGNALPAELRRRPDGLLRVRDGHRRAIMCTRAGVPLFAFIAGAEGDEQADTRARLIGQWYSNHHREDFRRSDDARLLLTLFDQAGMTEAGIAKALGVKRAAVKTSLAVARSEIASAAVDQWAFLDLEQGAALEEFAGDDGAVTALVSAARTGGSQFEQTLRRLRATKTERDAKLVFLAELEAAGYLVYGERPYVPWTLELTNLRTPDGAQISGEEHAACPGAAVTISYDWAWESPEREAAYRTAHDLADDDEIEYRDLYRDPGDTGFGPRWVITKHLCNDPAAAGHVNIHGVVDTPTTGQEAAQTEADKAAAATEERRRVRTRNIAWRAATEVRREHLTRWLAAARLPKTVEDQVTRYRAKAIARNETTPEMGSFGHRVAATLLGLKDRNASDTAMIEALIDAATTNRVKVIELAIVLGAAEHGCGGADGTDAETWRSAETSWFRRSGKDRRVRYLEWLAANTGYALSDIETEVVAAYAPKPGPEGAPADVAPPAEEADTGDGLSPAARRQARINAEVIAGLDTDRAALEATTILAVDAGHITPAQACEILTPGAEAGGLDYSGFEDRQDEAARLAAQWAASAGGLVGVFIAAEPVVADEPVSPHSDTEVRPDGSGQAFGVALHDADAGDLVACRRLPGEPGSDLAPWAAAEEAHDTEDGA